MGYCSTLIRCHSSSLVPGGPYNTINNHGRGHCCWNWRQTTHLQSKAWQLSIIRQACHVHLQALQQIRSSLTYEDTSMIGRSVVAALIDYYNSLFTGVSENNLNKLQCTQNCAACIVFNVGRKQLSSQDNLLADKQWLPVCHHVEFKITTQSSSSKLINCNDLPIYPFL